MCVFSFLVIVIFTFAFPPGMGDVERITPGILWVAFIFSGLLGMGRSFGVEKDKGSLQVSFLGPLGLIIILGTLGFTVVGTIFSAMSANTRARDVMLSLLVFPIAVPLIIASIKATGKILEGAPISEITSWVKILVAFDLTFLMVSYLAFEYVVEE
jgi:heme exporter protein B